MPQQEFVRFGGVKFTRNVPARQINTYVRNLPDDYALYDVVKSLSEAGLITIINDGEMGTVDQGFKDLMEREYAKFES